ncbi:MAG: hypothetical protein VYB44_07270 [Bacteroidota bacterium]|nr:hypothetical protein [Bacteroidota bacterium]
MNIKEIKKKHKLTDANLADIFGYKNAVSYTTSSAKKRIERGIEQLYGIIKESPK